MPTPIRSVLGPIAALFLCVFGLTVARANTVEFVIDEISPFYGEPTPVDLDDDTFFDFTVTVVPFETSTLLGNGGFNVASTGSNIATSRQAFQSDLR